MSEILPALTAEQWAAGGEGVLDGYVDWSGAVDVRLGGPMSATRDAARDRHALAALALHAQPFGFTRADLDLLRVVVQDYLATAERDEGTDRELRSHALAAGCDHLADRIETLLPPREQR